MKDIKNENIIFQPKDIACVMNYIFVKFTNDISGPTVTVTF